MIEARELTERYGDTTAVHSLSVTIATGTVTSGRWVWGTPKTHARRSVPLPRFLADELSRTVVIRRRDELAFPRRPVRCCATGTHGLRGRAGQVACRGSGDEGNRTPNPRLAKAVLCQLSYVP